ncbi:hypothetical protein OROGR_015702 [Orobanche gracilis]
MFFTEMALSHLLQPKSSLQIFRLGFLAATTRCCFSLPELKQEAGVEVTGSMTVEETGNMAVEPFLKESSGESATFITHKKATHTGLADLFRKHKGDQMETTEHHEGAQLAEALSDVLFDIHSKNRNLDFECLSHPNDPLSGEPASGQDGILKEPFSPDILENDRTVSHEGGGTSSSFSRICKALHLKDLPMNPAINQAVSEIDKPRSLVYSYEPFELSSKPHPKPDTENMPDIKDLIEIIRVPKSELSDSTTTCINKGFTKKNALDCTLQTSDDTYSVNPPDIQDGASENEDMETSNLDFKSTNFADAKEKLEVLVPRRNNDKKRSKGTQFPRKETDENRVLVRFLRKTLAEDFILQHFNSCGEILDFEFRNTGQSLFRSAYICFKTREGLMKARQKSGECLSNWIINVESANSVKNVKIPIPSLIGDHDVPVALVKNPTRTIKIKKLTSGISSYHIKEALAFCESNVSGYFLGSSYSVAYVEFETEIGKERALAKQFINVLGRDLVMLKIDCPRTTVVRIVSNINSVGIPNLLSVCRSLGDVKFWIRRNNDILDVHFGFAEWPKMLEILNRLNGLEVKGVRLQAEPAPVYPPDVLLALWCQPEERKHLKGTMQVLLRKLGENKLTSDLASLQHIFVDNI